MKSNARGKVLMLIGALFVACALILTGYNIFRTKSAESSARKALLALKGFVPASDHSYGDGDNSLLQIRDKDEIEIPDYVLNPEMNMPEAEIDGWAYIGYLEICDLAAELPIITEWSYSGLNVAPCRYSGSAYTNNLVLAAHNYESHFGKLNELSPGSMIIFTDIDGNNFLYEVSLIETLLPTDVEEMTSGEWDLTLFTCTLGGASRVTVRCEQVYE